ncbi:sulfatase [Pedobacter sp. MW01-1-1]|uniref:sulfatase n=1 Tax=Pedobacter sp. MW01-1-1 TaxID=3383027 RepID=UPI003FED408B
MNTLNKNQLLILAVLLLFSTQKLFAQKQPNIIVFLVDDMGWQDTSVPFWNKTTEFNKRYHTPNMERMAKSGMKFTNAYANPVCTPTRVSFITGVNSSRTHVTNWTNPDKNVNTDRKDSTLLSVNWNINGFSPQPNEPRTFYATALPAVLKENGYYTVHSGKAHFGSKGTPGSNPLNVGFDVNIAGNEIGHPASYYGEKNYDNPNKNGKPNRNAVPGLEKYHGTHTFLSDAITTEALAAIEKPIQEKKPFFLYLAHYAVHAPILPDSRYVDKYLSMGLDKSEAAYASLIEGMDKSLGDVLDFLVRSKIDKNTVVIFMSDNGGLSVTPRGGTAWTHNLPLKGGKGSVYEGGIREPMLIQWPGVVKPGSIAEQYVLIDDFMPTIMAIAGIKKPKLVQKLDGESFLPILKNPALKKPERELVWHRPNTWGIAIDAMGVNFASAFRKGDWKIVYDFRKGKLELYNLKDDIAEMNNLATSNPEKVKELAILFTKKLKANDAQMPVYKATGKTIPWPDEL